MVPRGRRRSWLIESGTPVPLSSVDRSAEHRSRHVGRDPFHQERFSPKCPSRPTPAPPSAPPTSSSSTTTTSSRCPSPCACARRACTPSGTPPAAATASSPPSRPSSPGVVLLDLDLGRGPDGEPIDGTTLVAGLCRNGWRVIVLSATTDDARIGRALDAGALACVPKTAALPVLITAIRRATQGLRGDAPGAAPVLHHEVPAAAGAGAGRRAQTGPPHRPGAGRAGAARPRPASAVDRRGVPGLARDDPDADPGGAAEAGGERAAGGRRPAQRATAARPAASEPPSTRLDGATARSGSSARPR